MQSLLSLSEYHTPDERRPGLLKRFFPGATVPFYIYAVVCVMRARARAVRGQYGDEAWAASSQMVADAVEACGGRLHITGLDVMPRTPGTVVFAGNHMSTLETFMLPGIIAPFKPLTFVVKESLTTHPIFGPVMRSRDPVTVTRRNKREDFRRVMEQGKAILVSGDRSICLFPQSTRSFEFVSDKFNTMAVKLAQRAGVPVIPFAVRTDFCRSGKWIKDFGPVDRTKDVHIAFGEAVPVGQRAKEAHAQILDFICERLTAWDVPCSR